jgi:lysozyme family protein
MGLGTAARLLQTALAVEIDGDIGPVTLAAARAAPPRAVVARYAGLRRARYRGLATFWRFGRGWLARVDRTEAAALTLIPPANPEGDPAMADATAPATQSPQWWAHSLTVWGTIVTTAATVLPVVGPLIGLDLTPQLVQALGDGVVQVAQAIGAVVGIVMTIWGRSRATGPLERRTVTLQL